MNSLRDISIVNMNLIPALVFIGMSDMLRALLAFELEERLGRKPTDWECQYFLQESNRKSDADSRQQIIRQWRQQLVGMKIIHDFVWEDNSRIH